MKPRPAPYKELTDPANERITGTLNSRAWAKLSGLATRSLFFSQEFPTEDWINPQKEASLEAAWKRPQEILVHEARQSSGSVDGQHRRDLVSALQGIAEGKQGLSVVEQEDGMAERGGI